MAFQGVGGWQVHDDAGRRKYLTSDELTRLLSAADRRAPSMRALCYVLAYTGCRVSEALALSRHQLDTERMTILIKTLKRRRTVYRVVPIPAAVVDMLRQLPPTADGRFWTMHRATAWRNLKGIMRRVGIVGPMATLRGIRHGFGIRAADRNVPPNLIQRWMGHASPSTTAIYLDAVGPEERQFASRMW